MKRYYSMIVLTLFFCVMLLFPLPVFEGASTGLLLWFHTVLPTLFPFIIISNLLIQTDTIIFISKLIGPFIGKVFCISHMGSFAVLAGFLCGYPMGAKITADLVKTNKISLCEGNYLLSFCNNSSPMFILSYVVMRSLGAKDFAVPTLIILLLSPVLCSFIFRWFYPNRHHFHEVDSIPLTQQPFRFSMLDSCLMNGVELMVKIGGYIMLFSIMIALVEELPFSLPVIDYIALPMLEITRGVTLLSTGLANETLRFILILGLTSFGGVCAIAQTQCMIQDTKLSIGFYIIEKLITMFVTSLLAYLYILL